MIRRSLAVAVAVLCLGAPASAQLPAGGPDPTP
ncbi:MAG: hypothetical protein QOE87_2575, partial [Gaiellales bacterium]|nr:hypothetical protein [Gaiellales bacterium]